jgi:hypothetical protein
MRNFFALGHFLALNLDTLYPNSFHLFHADLQETQIAH